MGGRPVTFMVDQNHGFHYRAPMGERFFLFMAYWIMISLGVTGGACFVAWDTDIGSWSPIGRGALLIGYLIAGGFSIAMEGDHHREKEKRKISKLPYSAGVEDAKRQIKTIPSINFDERQQIDALVVEPTEESLANLR